MSAAAAPTVEKKAQAARLASEATPTGEDARWAPVLGLRCEITVDLPVPHFRVSNFLALRQGSVLSTRFGVGRDVPARVNGILIGWSELEAAGNRLAVRLTELA